MYKKSNQVISIPNGWAVIKYGAGRASKRFDTKEEAIEYGRKLSRKEETILYVHNKDGTVQNRYSYIKDSKLVMD